MKRLTAIAAGAVASTLALSAVSLAAPAYVVHADLVRGDAGVPQGPVCVPNSVFYPGESVVVRTQVYDGETGQQLDAATIAERGIEVQPFWET